MKRIGRWLANLILPYGTFGIFLLALIDSAAIPMPGGVDLLLFYQVLKRPDQALLAAGLAVLGSLIGCLFLYYVSRKAGHAALQKHVTHEKIEKMRGTFERYEALTLVLPTMVPLPLPMKLFVIAAGVFEVRVPYFVGAIAFGRAVRYFGIALLARHYGPETMTLIQHHWILVGVGATALLGGFYLFSKRWR